MPRPSKARPTGAPQVLAYACVYSFYSQDAEHADVLEQQTENLELHTNALQILLGAPPPPARLHTPFPSACPASPPSKQWANSTPNPAPHRTVLILHSLITDNSLLEFRYEGTWYLP